MQDNLKAIKERHAKATEGPWSIQRPDMYGMPILCDNEDRYIGWINNAEFANTDADGYFIAHSKADMQTLFTLLDEKEKEVERLTGLLDKKDISLKRLTSGGLGWQVEQLEQQLNDLTAQLTVANAEVERLTKQAQLVTPDQNKMAQMEKELEFRRMNITKREDFLSKQVLSKDEAIGNVLSQLTTAQEKVKELTKERDLAIAHDSQPYPTADAYEKVCEKIHRLEAKLQAEAWVKVIEENDWGLIPEDVPTGGDDYDVVWSIFEYHMAKPHKRRIGHGKTPAEAVKDAISRKEKPVQENKGNEISTPKE